MQTDEFDKLLARMLKNAEGTSDLIFVAGKSPQQESFGTLKSFDDETPLSSNRIQVYAKSVINGNQRLVQDLQDSGSCDTSYSVPDVGRFRVNIYKQNGNYAMVLRKLASSVPTLQRLNLPPIFNEMVKEKTGLIFVTGATGSGKTTTLAAMLNEINQSAPVHVVTLEDPIEFVHTHGNAIFSQREFGRDFFSFADGLRAALRQAPKVILVGEIRDRQTMEVALTAAETGHLVFSTLHTISAAQTINRILGLFSREEEEQTRHRLAETLRYVVTQRLVPKIGGGRLLATELMGSNLRTREAITEGEGENRRISDIIESNESSGWHSFEQSLLKAFKAELITEETAVLSCTNKTRMRQMIDGSRKQRNPGPEAVTIKMKVEEPAPEGPILLKLKGDKAPKAETKPAMPELRVDPVERVEPEMPQLGDTFEMICPKCGSTAVLPIEFFDLLVDCPTCKHEALARPYHPKPPVQLSSHTTLFMRDDAHRQSA